MLNQLIWLAWLNVGKHVPWFHYHDDMITVPLLTLMAQYCQALQASLDSSCRILIYSILSRKWWLVCCQAIHDFAICDTSAIVVIDCSEIIVTVMHIHSVCFSNSGSPALNRPFKWLTLFIQYSEVLSYYCKVWCKSTHIQYNLQNYYEWGWMLFNMEFDMIHCGSALVPPMTPETDKILISWCSFHLLDHVELQCDHSTVLVEIAHSVIRPPRYPYL